MPELDASTLGEVIRDRRRLIQLDAPCEGCGSTLADCLAQRGKDSTAPPWFGCCARGTGMIPCAHHSDPVALSALLDEIAAGAVRTAGEVVAERDARAILRKQRRGPVTGSIFDQGEWWRKRDGSFVRIAEMAAGHRYNAAAMLMRSASVHALRAVLQFGFSIPDEAGDMTMNSLEAAFGELTDLTERDPAGWLRGTTLYRALTAGLKVKGDPSRSWQTNGRDPVTGKKVPVPTGVAPVCMDSSCGCSGKAHA